MLFPGKHLSHLFTKVAGLKLTRRFSVNFCEIFKETNCFIEHLWTTASISIILFYNSLYKNLLLKNVCLIRYTTIEYKK